MRPDAAPGGRIIELNVDGGPVRTPRSVRRVPSEPISNVSGTALRAIIIKTQTTFSLEKAKIRSYMPYCSEKSRHICYFLAVPGVGFCSTRPSARDFVFGRKFKQSFRHVWVAHQLSNSLVVGGLRAKFPGVHHPRT